MDKNIININATGISRTHMGLDKNNFILLFDSDRKKLKLKDENGYSYIIPFEEKQLNNNSQDTDININVKRQLKDIALIVQKIQSTGKIGPQGMEGKRGIKGNKGDIGLEGPPGPGLRVNFMVKSKEKLPLNVTEGDIGLIERILDIYIYKSQQWQLIGNLRGKQGMKGNDGKLGPIGPKGNKGDKGDRFQFDFTIQNMDQFNERKDKLDAQEGDYMITNKECKLYTYQDGEWLYVTQFKGNIGEKGDKGDGIKIDLICDNTSELLDKSDMVDNYALIKNSMELYYNNKRSWDFIGTIKGDKGDNGPLGKKGGKGDKGDYGEKGPRGLQGDKGDKGDKGGYGDGVHIDYFFESYKDLLNNKTNLIKNSVCLILETKELRYWDDEWRIIGTMNLTIHHKMEDIIYITGVKLLDVIDKESYEDIKCKDLKYINWQNINYDIEWIDKKGEKLFLKSHSNYIIKLNICWEINQSRIQKDILNEGLLLFVYTGDSIIQNSIKFDRGYPYMNNLSHEFLLQVQENSDIRFIVKIRENYFSHTQIFSEGCFLEIKKI